MSIELEKNQLQAGDVAGIRFRLTGSSKGSGIVSITCSPLGQQFDVQVTAN